MFCAECGHIGFPVRIACAVCNATLPDVPACLESPEEREKVKRVVCKQCGSEASDARIACTQCDASFPRPFELSWEEDTPPHGSEGVSYYTYVVPDAACDECRKFTGYCFLPFRLPEHRLPIKTCKFPVCWCGIWAVYTSGDSAEIVEFLERTGGAATGAQISAYLDGKRAPQRERSAKEGAAANLYARAFRAEKVSLDEAITLYRQSAAACMALLREDWAWGWSYLDDSYNRLTLILERARRFYEALQEIGQYRSFLTEMGREHMPESIAKRRARLEKKVGHLG